MHVGYGYGLAVSSMDNGLIAGEWVGEDETASKLPLPMQAECDGAYAVLFKMQEVILQRDACAESRRAIIEALDESKAEVAKLREGKIDQACALLTEIMALYPYQNCVCGRNKPRLSENLRESVRAFLGKTTP